LEESLSRIEQNFPKRVTNGHTGHRIRKSRKRHQYPGTIPAGASPLN